MGLPIVDSLSGLQESIFSLFRSSQLNLTHVGPMAVWDLLLLLYLAMQATGGNSSPKSNLFRPPQFNFETTKTHHYAYSIYRFGVGTIGEAKLMTLLNRIALILLVYQPGCYMKGLVHHVTSHCRCL